MYPASNHDHDLLIYSDWLEDQNRLVEAEWIRESIVAPLKKQWSYEYGGVGGGIGGVGGGISGIGGGGVVGVGVGSAVGGGVGGVGGSVGGGSVGVGGGIGVGSIY